MSAPDVLFLVGAALIWLLSSVALVRILPMVIGRNGSGGSRWSRIRNGAIRFVLAPKRTPLTWLLFVLAFVLWLLASMAFAGSWWPDYPGRTFVRLAATWVAVSGLAQLVMVIGRTSRKARLVRDDRHGGRRHTDPK